jgi:hypothetical protein
MKSKPSVEFIRLFFKSPTEEEFAVRCAQFIANIVGERVLLLRPDTTWSEIFQWLGPRRGHTNLHVELVRNALFADSLKKEFGAPAKEIIANSDFMTFRDLIEDVCRHELEKASRPPRGQK